MTAANPILQREAMTRKLDRRISCEGKVTLPAVPGMLDVYTNRCAEVFAALGRKLNAPELAELRKILDGQLKEAFSRSQRSNITVSYQSSVSGLLNYFVAPQYATIEQTYAAWVNTRKPPYFGTEPDAKVLAVAKQLGDARHQRVLDIGAGTGRNALALARLGHPVDAVELTPKFAEILSATAQQESLDIQVICKDVFEVGHELTNRYDLMLLSEVVSDFRSVAQLRALLELAAQHLAPNGVLLFNAFVARSHYSADDAAREFSQQVFSYFFTPEELSFARDGLPLVLVSDDNVYDYEKANQPVSAWPPTGWYQDWVTGLDVFDVPMSDNPIELRWLTFSKVMT